jgi:hypothetical protein
MVQPLLMPSGRKRSVWGLGLIRRRNWRRAIRFIETFSRSSNQSIIGCIGSSGLSSSSSSSKGVPRSCGVLSPTTWRGAALERVRSSRDFRFDTNTAETRENRRLPRTSQRDAFHPWPSIRLHSDRRAAFRWVIRGSRLLRRFLDGSRADTSLARSPYTCQSGSPPGGGR